MHKGLELDPREGPAGLDPIKHGRVVAGLSKLALRALTRRLEKLIFTATTGRSGTKALAKLFSAVPACASLHEPWPPMCGTVLRAASYGDSAFVNNVYHRMKSVNILRAAAGRRYYLESNHCFIKTFARQAIEEFSPRIAVIHLVRPPLDVATSIYRLREEPGTAIGNTWWLDHRAPKNHIRIADALDGGSEFSHPFYKALWYWYEIEACVTALRNSMPSLPVIRFETDWLTDQNRVAILFRSLGIEHVPTGLDRLSLSKINERDSQKTRADLPADEAEHMHLRFLELLAERGFAASDQPVEEPSDSAIKRDRAAV